MVWVWDSTPEFTTHSSPPSRPPGSVSGDPPTAKGGGRVSDLLSGVMPGGWGSSSAGAVGTPGRCLQRGLAFQDTQPREERCRHSHRAGVPFLLISRLTLGKRFDICEPQFLLCEMGITLANPRGFSEVCGMIVEPRVLGETAAFDRW